MIDYLLKIENLSKLKFIHNKVRLNCSNNYSYRMIIGIAATVRNQNCVGIFLFPFQISKSHRLLNITSQWHMIIQ